MRVGVELGFWTLSEGLELDGFGRNNSGEGTTEG